MKKIYIIRDDVHTWGCVTNKQSVAPYIILTGVLSIDDSADRDYDIVDLLECERDKEVVVEYLHNFSFPLQKIIFEQFGLFIEEEDIWDYEEYMYNKKEMR